MLIRINIILQKIPLMHMKDNNGIFKNGRHIIFLTHFRMHLLFFLNKCQTITM